MFRYFKSHLLLFIAAVLIIILTRLLIPVTAILEQQTVDFIIAGNFREFQRMLPVVAGVVIAFAFFYFTEALLQKKFQVRFEESLRNDMYDYVMRQSVVKFSKKDTSEHMSYIRSHASTISNNLTGPIFILTAYGLMAMFTLGTMLYYSLMRKVKK